MKPDVSIIFVNYNTKEMTADAIRSVFEKTEDLSYEIIVVDNASSDGSIQYLRDTFGDRIKVIDAGGNLGFGGANNLAMEQAKADYYFLLNTDTILINNAIKILYDYIIANTNVGIAGGNLYDEHNMPIHSFTKKIPSIKSFSLTYSLYSFVMKLFRGRKKRSDFNYTNKPMRVGYIVGADMMVRKDVINKVGGFDKDFFMYNEEIELASRVQKAGFKVISVPQAKIIHLEGASFGSKDSEAFTEKREVIRADSLFLYFEKVYGARRVKKFWKTRKRQVYFSTKLKKLFRMKNINQNNERIMQIFDEAYQKWCKKNINNKENN